MAIDWGSYNGHLRVGIDYSISPANPSHSDTSVDVTWKFYVGTDGWNFSGDTSYLHEGATGWGGTTTTFTNNLTSGSMLVDTVKRTYSISYNSGSVSANANLTGAYNGATPSNSRTVNLPNRPIAAPSNGENPQASAITSTGATISWSLPTDDGGDAPDKYELQLSTGSAFSSTVYDVSTITSRSQSVSGLSANTRYYFRVRAHNSAGWGDWTSSNYNFTTASGLPSVPGHLTETAKTTTSVSLGWSASDANGGGTVTYTCQLYSDAGLTTLVDSYVGTSTACVLDATTGLTPGTTYYARVKAANTNGSSAYSSTLTVTTRATSTYTDTGDLVTLIDNLASGVGSKLIHLGTSAWRGKTGTTTIANNTTTYFDPGTDIDTSDAGRHPPTYTGGTGSAVFTIAYPGVYEIEFLLGAPGNSSTQALELSIYVNGNNAPSHASSNPKGGAAIACPWNANVHGAAQVARCVRRLEVGDTVGFSAYQTTGSSITTQAWGSGDYTMTARITLVGF